MFTSQQLFNFLDELKIKYQNYIHKPVFTVEQAMHLYEELPQFGQCKNLFLKDSKKNLWLVVALFDTQIRLKELSKKINAPELRFADEKLLLEFLGVTPGSVTPLGLVNDKNHVVKVILDQRLFDQEILGFHPLSNDATILITPQDLQKLINVFKNQFQILNFQELKN
ncbi:MAG: prolyl-tRNA synthetase associated domain-containing protein [bacterium]